MRIPKTCTDLPCFSPMTWGKPQVSICLFRQYNLEFHRPKAEGHHQPAARTFWFDFLLFPSLCKGLSIYLSFYWCASDGLLHSLLRVDSFIYFSFLFECDKQWTARFS
ncbi:hypothetical protein CY34DRAFT_246197 [Suillus luteus UH-Slu-Lm8-n1]|uniref:Uncharacterized protein n=1 Tax=Suillus luteus UH-Slu-Lm8-n1 TaxID=930992 RepID=A0A0D0BC68_9AGAM|nr:hypothetical protein CY34DRAFT_246197 [Suillus luteus UH-Slu-Lm8-n1]